jgi:hypothetical protein
MALTIPANDGGMIPAQEILSSLIGMPLGGAKLA